MPPLSVTSAQLENQETTRVDVYPSGNVTFFGNETSSSKNESTFVTDGQSKESANTTMSESTTSGPRTLPTVTFNNRSITEVVIHQYEEDANNGLHVIHPAVAISPGTYGLEIDYEIMLDGKAIYSASFGESGEER